MAARKKSTTKPTKPATKKSKTNTASRKTKPAKSTRRSTAATNGKKASTASREKTLKTAAATRGAKESDKREAEKKAAAPRKTDGAAKTAKHGRAEAQAATTKVVEAPAAAKPVEANKISAPEATVKKSVAAAAAAPVAPAPVAPNAAGAAAAQRALQPAQPPKGPFVAKTAKVPPPAKMEREDQSGDQKAMKTNGNRNGFKLNEFVVYPSHGVGQIVAVEEQEVAGFKLELFVINFVKDKMTLRVPTSKVAGVGMRKLSDPDTRAALARDPHRPRAHQAHDVVAPRAGIRSQDQFRRHQRDRRGGARPLSVRRRSPSSPIPSANSTRRRSTG